MTSNQKNFAVFGAALAAFSVPAWIYLQQHGWSDDSLGVTLRSSARIALLIYLLVFIARPLRDLSASNPSRALLKNRRFLGISFAAIMTAHLYLLITLNGPVVDHLGVVIYSFIYLMLITSFNKPTAALGPKWWKVLHKTGLYVIGIALAQAQFARILSGVGEPVHFLLAGLILIAIGLRVAAWNKKRASVQATGT